MRYRTLPRGAWASTSCPTELPHEYFPQRRDVRDPAIERAGFGTVHQRATHLAAAAYLLDHHASPQPDGRRSLERGGVYDDRRLERLFDRLMRASTWPSCSLAASRGAFSRTSLSAAAWRICCARGARSALRPSQLALETRVPLGGKLDDVLSVGSGGRCGPAPALGYSDMLGEVSFDQALLPRI